MHSSLRSIKITSRVIKTRSNIRLGVIVQNLDAKKSTANVFKMGLDAAIFVNALIVKMEMINANPPISKMLKVT